MSHKIELTIYERTRVLGTRAMMLSKGGIPMVPIDGLTEAKEIAKKELRLNKMPLIIRRKMPDGTYVEIKLSDMIV